MSDTESRSRPATPDVARTSGSLRTTQSLRPGSKGTKWSSPKAADRPRPIRVFEAPTEMGPEVIAQLNELGVSGSVLDAAPAVDYDEWCVCPPQSARAGLMMKSASRKNNHTTCACARPSLCCYMCVARGSM
jgi:hypothetical protein